MSSLGASAAGASAESRGRQEQRARRRLFALAWLLTGAALLMGVTWAAASGGGPAGTPRWLSGAVAVVLGVGAGCTWAAGWLRGDAGRWARGAAGERATAQLLEELPRRRWAVLHDLRVPASRANIDHLVIGPTGVWVVDSKAFRAPLQAGWRKVRAGGTPVGTSSVRWEAEVVSSALGVPARPIVVVHGAGLVRRGRLCRGRVWVVPADGLLRRLKRGQFWRAGLSRGEVRDLAERAGDRFGAYLPATRL